MQPSIRSCTTFFAHAVLAASAAVLAPSSHAADTDAACRTMTAKLATQYEPLQKALKAGAASQDRRSRIDAAVVSAYGMRKVELDQKWAGLFEWSISEIETGLIYGVPAAKFAQVAYADCLMKFDVHAE
jgi:hypothetical protein